MRSLSEPLSLLSKDHWNQYADIEIQDLKPGSGIVIAGTCPTQGAERVLREWVKWLEDEVAEANAMQNTGERDYRLELGNVSYCVEPKKVNGRPLYEFLPFRFNIDEKMVFERLFGKALYGRGDLALRELLQNAVDAQRAYLLKILADTVIGWGALSVSQKRAHFLAQVEKQREDLPIKVRLGSEGIRQVITIQDRGIGMTRHAIDRYLLKVGRSRWSGDAQASQLGMGAVSIGKFGIGFLSALMLADTVEIDTKSCMPDEDGIRATIYGWHGFLATEPSTRTSHGTNITLQLSEKVFSSEAALAARLSELAPLVEFPVIVETESRQVKVPRMSMSRGYTLRLGSGESRVNLLRSGRRTHDENWIGDTGVIEELQKTREKLTVVQDGLTVAEVGPPTGSTEAEVLCEHQVLLDLRGDGRVDLDLSRNLPEGGSVAFWEEHLELIWRAIGAESTTSRDARYFVGLLGERLLLREKGTRALLVVCDTAPNIRGVSNVPEGLVAFLDHDSSDDLGVGRAACVLPTDQHHLADELMPAGTGEQDGRRGRLQTAILRLNRDFRSLLRSRPILFLDGEILRAGSKADAGSAGCLVDGVIGFRVSRRWYALRNLYTHAFSLVPAMVVDRLLEVSERLACSRGDAYAAMSHLIFPHEDVDSPVLGGTPLGSSMSAGLAELDELTDSFTEVCDFDREYLGDEGDARYRELLELSGRLGEFCDIAGGGGLKPMR